MLLIETAQILPTRKLSSEGESGRGGYDEKAGSDYDNAGLDAPRRRPVAELGM